MKKVITFGVFDYFHYGHLKLFERARALGDYLIVAVQDGDLILKYKPEAEIMYSTEQRCEMVNALKCVDEVVIYTDIDKSIKEFDFDIWAKGPDQAHEGFVKAVEWAKENGKEVITLPRTPNISSTQIRGDIKKK